MAHKCISVDESFEQGLRTAGLADFEALATLPALQCVTDSRTIRTDLIDVPTVGVCYRKSYIYPTWRDKRSGLFRTTAFALSRARREYENLRVLAGMEGLGAQPVAFGVQRVMGLVDRSFVITRQLEGARALDDRALSEHVLADRRQRRLLVDSLARRVAEMHRAGFYHGDLNWRNVLVRRHGNSFDVVLIDCPRGKLRHRPITPTLRAFDLASLDAPASVLCGRTCRLRFLTTYLRHAPISETPRRLIARIAKARSKIIDREIRRLPEGLKP